MITGKRAGRFARPKPAADFEARDARQHPVEDHEVGRVLRQPQLRLVAALDVLDHIAFRLEIVAEQQGQIRFVLDDQDARRGRGSRTDDLLARLVHLIAPRRVSLDVRPLPPVRPLGRQRRTRHQIDHGFGDVGRVIADPLDVLRAKQKMGAERDVARILHHMRQKIAEHRIFERIEIDVPLPDVERPLDVALGVGVEHVLHQFGRELVHVLDADDGVGHPAFDADLDRALGDVLGEIADPLEIARDPNGADDLAQVDRHRLPARDRQRRLLLDLALQEVEPRIGLHHLMRKRGVAGGERVDRVDHHFLGQAAHLGDPPLEQVKVLVVGSDSMLIRHGDSSLSRSGQ